MLQLHFQILLATVAHFAVVGTAEHLKFLHVDGPKPRHVRITTPNPIRIMPPEMFQPHSESLAPMRPSIPACYQQFPLSAGIARQASDVLYLTGIRFGCGDDEVRGRIDFHRAQVDWNSPLAETEAKTV